MRSLHGLHTAMVTPMHGDGSVNEQSAVALGRHLLANGSDGLVVCGTTGEAATLSDDEQLRLIRLIREELGETGVVIAGAGSNDTRHAAELTHSCAEIGVDAILSVTPYYNRPSPLGIRRHFEEVARAAGGVPVILYNIPSRTGMNMGPELLAQLAQIDGVVGVKQSNNDELQLIDGLDVFAGNDDIVARTLDMGGAGGICVASHIVGPQMKRMWSEPDKRAEIEASLQDVFETLFITANPTPTKAALNLLGHDTGGLRLPLVEATQDELAQIRAMLSRHGLLSEATTG